MLWQLIWLYSLTSTRHVVKNVGYSTKHPYLYKYHICVLRHWRASRLLIYDTRSRDTCVTSLVITHIKDQIDTHLRSDWYTKMIRTYLKYKNQPAKYCEVCRLVSSCGIRKPPIDLLIIVLYYYGISNNYLKLKMVHGNIICLFSSCFFNRLQFLKNRYGFSY